MYERFIPQPVTLDDFADHFKRNIGDINTIERKKMFCGWMMPKFRQTDIQLYLGEKHCSSITYYQRTHFDHLETDEVYRKKFQAL